MKQNGGHFWKSIFLQNSLTNYWFQVQGFENRLLNCTCIFLNTNQKARLKNTCPCQRNEPKLDGACLIYFFSVYAYAILNKYNIKF